MDSPPPVGHVFFSGLNEPCSVDSLVEVVVNTKGGSSGVAPGNVSVFATSPAGIKRKCDVVRRENAFTATFTPDRIGKWLIGILYEGGHIRGSPFACQVFDASIVNVYGLDVGLIGQELGFTVDASRAEEPKGSNIHRIRFTPQGPGQYKVLVTFNNQPVKGSPFMLDIADSNAISVYGEQLRLAAVDRPAEFFVHSPGVQSARQISCAITGPSGKRKMARIVPQEVDGTCRVEWKPSEAGEHLIDVLVNDRTAYESPFVCQVGDPDLVTVRRMPPLIEARNLHRPHTFEIDATAAGSGNLEIVINGGRVACRVRETNPRHFLAEFTPVQEAKHTVEMRFNGEHVRDSPWHIQLAGSGSAAGSPAASLERERAATRELAALRRCEQRAAGSALNGREYGGVAEEFVDGNGEDIITELIGPGLNRAAVNELAHFSIHSNQRLRSSNVVVRIVERVSGRPVDVQMDERGPGTVQCEYILPRVADYALEVYINGRRMDTEPLIISGFDPRRIRVRLKEPEEFRPGKIAQFTVDAAEAGKGQLEISVNQGQVPNNVQMQDAGRCLVTFIPQHSGTYVIDVTFNGLQVHGCPIEVDVRERQVGKPVSAPVFARPAATTSVYGGSPPPPRGGSGPLERGPSSAYHSSVSPHADTASSYAPSPSSPALVARAHSQHASPAEHRRREASAEPAAAGGGSGSGGDLRSTSLLQSAMRQREKSEPPRGLLGYTVAQYDKTTTTTHTVERRMSPLPPSRESQFGRRISSSPPPPSSQAVSPTHKYFGGTENNVNNSNNKVPPETGTAQFEMTRSAELTLLKEHPSTSEPAPIKKEPTTSPPALSEFHKAREVPYAPLDQRARRTVELLRAQQLHAAGHEAASAAGTVTPTSPQPTTVEQRITIDQQQQQQQQQQRRFVPTHIVDPFSSDIVQADTPTTPGTRRARLQEHGVHKATDLKETALPLPSPIEGRGGSATTTDHEAESETLSSKHSSKATTPRLGLKFRGKDKSEGGGGAFEWGKSKISSKHSVVRRGKEVEVKLDGLKLGKEDDNNFNFIYIFLVFLVVTPPATTAVAGAPQRAAELTPAAVQQQNAPELTHRLRKTGSKTWEIGFKPAEVGTHKVLVFVNSLPHPQTPFPIRVYDAGQIVVEDIVTEATVNDTVEFTVDAGRAGFGNLEMAIKDHDGIIIPSHVSQIESGTAKFLVTFNPATAGTHTVHITFNKEVVRGSPFEVHILEPSPAQADGAAPMSSGKKKKDKKSKQSLNGTRSKSPVGRETAASSPGTLTVSEPPSLSRVDRPIELFVTVTNPDAAVQAQAYDVNSREAVPVELRQDGPTTRRVVFTPRRVGDHEVRLLLDGTEVEDSPFTCRVYDPAKILVGPIADGGVDVPVKFVVDASQAGVGNLEVAVNEGKIPSTASGLGHHKYQITFVPKEPIDHTISVQFNNEPVPGSPFTCHLLVPEKEIVQQQPHRVRPISPSFSVTASGPGLERIPVGQLTEFFVDILPDEEDGAEPVVEHLPKVQITDPRGDLLPVDVAAYEEEPTRSIVRYTPQSVGNYQVSVQYEGQSVPGSPFTVKAFDADCVKLTLDEPAKVGRSCTFTIDAAKAGAGNMEIIVSVGKRNVPNYVQAEGQARFKVSFTPQEAQEHQISVKFNGIPVPASPLRCAVVAAASSHRDEAVSAAQPAVAEGPEEEEELRLVGDLASARLGEPKRFSIDVPPPHNGRVECNVVVVGPDQRRVPVQKERVNGGSFDIGFTPTQQGDHHIDIQINGRSLAICPVVCRCVAVAADSVARGRQGPICGQEYAFEMLLARPTRPAQLRAECVAMDGTKPTGSPVAVPIEMAPDSDRSGPDDQRHQRFVGTFRPLAKPQQYQFTLFRDGVVVEERVFEAVQAPAVDEPVRLVLFPEPVLVEHVASLELEPTGAGPVDRVKVQIFEPSGNELPVVLRTYADGTIRAEWQPASEGRHRFVVRDGSRHLCGSPLPVSVLDLSAVRLVGLHAASVGVEQNFSLDWSNSGGQWASVSVQHESGELLKCTMKRQKRGVHAVSFTPRLPGLHFLTILIDAMMLPECPYECVVGAEGAPLARGDALAKAQRGKTARFEVSPGTAAASRELDVVVTNPQGSPLPVRCYKQQDDSYWVEFAPEVCGSHSVEVMFGEQPVPGSPFHCEVVDPRRVQVHGVDRPFTMRTMANFIVSRKGAGNGPLAIELVDPQNEQVTLDRVLNSTGDESFTFLPTRLGPHKLGLKLAGFAVQGSPFSLVVEEQREPCVYGAALDYAIERGQQASMIFDPNKKSGGLKIDVRGPSGDRVKHGTNRRPDDSTEISFKPQEVGNYTVDVLFNNRAVHGSPYIVAVVDPSKVLVNNERLRPVDGLLQLDAGQRNVLDVDTTGAGPVKLRVEVRDGDGELLGGETAAAEMNALDNHNKHQLLFTPPKVGKYKLYLYCSELVVPSAYPLLAIAEKTGQPAEEDRDEMSKVILRGEGLSIARVREPAEFIIDASEVHANVGKVSAALLGERADVPVKVSALRNQVYKAIYTPLMGGTYQLVVQIDAKNVPGSPSTVQVHSNQLPAELIEVDVRPLKFGVINEDLRTMIDARKATAGHLSAQCSGPTRPEYCELLDNRDGTYVLRVRPKELGRHSLTIKYDNENVPGSPIVFNVTNPPDPTKVKVYGPGIEHGILHSFKSNFVVETKGAGAGQLTVRVRGPKGAFNVEMQRDTAQERTIHCKYEPREPGDYQVEVKWHGHHVPGSPFFVLIVDTEHELQRFLAGGAPSPTPTSPFVPPGWMPPPPPPGVLPLPPIMPSPPPHFRGPHLKAMQMLPPPSPAHHQQAIYGARHHY
uniref:Filamin-C n=1 Tax=Globodera rostochiensis TaxID=31243 RepID=A0A914H238_GLORO